MMRPLVRSTEVAMATRSSILAAIGFGLWGALADVTSAGAADVKVWTARLIATVLHEVGSQFEHQTGHRLEVSEIFGPELLNRLRAGAAFDTDVLILRYDFVDALIKDGRLRADTRTDLVKTGIGVEVRAGAPKPDVSTVEAFKQALLKAKSVAYLNNGIESAYLGDLLRQLGIADAVKPKLILPETDAVSTLTANDEVELGIAITTQIVTTPGVELAGEFPPEIQRYYVFAGAVSAHSQSLEAAVALLKFLKSPALLPVIRAQGMEPG
jgi:molybdate transport system substrate-binding protein